MPVIKSAIKKLRRDKKAEKANDLFRNNLSQIIKLAKKQKTATAVSKAFSQVDRAVKKNLMHASRAAHIKSSLSKLAKPASKNVQKAAVAPKKTSSKAVKPKKAATPKAK